MYLQSLASATPPHSYTQAESWEAIRSSPEAARLRGRSLKLLEKVLLGDSGIDRRSLFLPEPAAAFGRGPEELNQQFERFAPQLSGEALSRALAGAGVAPGELDALFTCTCTGYLCPGISSHLAEALGCRPDAYLHDLVGLGCGAAVPMLRAASGFLAENPGATVATVAVEICSAAFYIDDDPGVLISLCLFGDAAAAAVWRGEGAPGAWRAGDWQTLHQPEHREKIRFVNSGGMLKNQLHKTVPALSAEAVAELHAARPSNAMDAPILAHTGGRDVIDAIEGRLGLAGDRALAETREVLRRYGNCSSPCVLLALEEHLARRGDDAPDAAETLWLTAFGAGFAAHACTLAKT